MSNDDVDSFFSSVGRQRAQNTAGAELDEGAFLWALGKRLRRARLNADMSRRLLAEQSGISERYIVEAEHGRGNLSVLLLRNLARSLGVTPVELLEGPRESRLDDVINRLSPEQLVEAHGMLTRRFSAQDVPARAGRVALLGMSGAGKSTLGALLAKTRGAAFVELDEEIAAAAGMAFGELTNRFSEAGIARLQQRVIEQLMARDEALVIAVGSDIANAANGFNLLLRGCRTVWLRAEPEILLRRAAPRAGAAVRGKRLADLRSILATWEPHFNRADGVLDTSLSTPEESLTALRDLVA